MIESFDDENFSIDDFFLFIGNTVLSESDYASLINPTSGYHLVVFQRVGTDAIKISLFFEKGQTVIIEKYYRNGGKRVFVRGSLLYEHMVFDLEETLFSNLEVSQQVELKRILADVDYALMGTELDWE